MKGYDPRKVDGPLIPGYGLPSDYNGPELQFIQHTRDYRWNDLTAASQRELLKYYGVQPDE